MATGFHRGGEVRKMKMGEDKIDYPAKQIWIKSATHKNRLGCKLHRATHSQPCTVHIMDASWFVPWESVSNARWYLLPGLAVRCDVTWPAWPVTVRRCDHRDCEGGLIKPRPGHPLVRWTRMRQFLCSCSPLLRPAFTKKAAVPNWETDKKILIPTSEAHKAHLLHPHVHLQGGRLGFEPFSKSENIIQNYQQMHLSFKAFHPTMGWLMRGLLK